MAGWPAAKAAGFFLVSDKKKPDCILLKIMEENGEELFGSIDDDDELDKVYNYYMEEIFADEDEGSDGGAEE